jgi:hypothetical protein
MKALQHYLCNQKQPYMVHRCKGKHSWRCSNIPAKGPFTATFEALNAVNKAVNGSRQSETGQHAKHSIGIKLGEENTESYISQGNH